MQAIFSLRLLEKQQEFGKGFKGSKLNVYLNKNSIMVVGWKRANLVVIFHLKGKFIMVVTCFENLDT